MRKAIVMVLIPIAFSMLLISTNIVTLLEGSHTITGLTSDSNDVNCKGCHSRIQEQLNRSAIHTGFKCEECHRITRTAGGKEIKYAKHNSSGILIGNQSHAAYTPRCLDCHGGNGVYYNDSWVVKQAPPAPAFNLSNYGSDYSAHKELVEKSLNYNFSVCENEACLACHTNFSVGIKHSYFWNISYTKSGSSWTLANFNVNGTRTCPVSITKSCGKHEWINTTKINCTKCHKNIYDALVNGTSQSPYNAYTHAPIEIDYYDSPITKKDHDWPLSNYWSHTRYHYIPASNRMTWVNTTYCIKCHNVAWYANQNPSDSSTYDLTNVTSDTNSTFVHAAESIRCIICHGYGKTKDPYNVIANSGYWGNEVGHRNFMNQTSSYARTFNGDMCMGCHEAASHNVDSGAQESGSCMNCHNYRGYARCGACHSDYYNYNIDVIIESEPSGDLTQSTY